MPEEIIIKGIQNFNSKILELSSELASKRVDESGCQKIWVDRFETQYTEDAQDLFNEYFEFYEEIIREIII